MDAALFAPALAHLTPGTWDLYDPKIPFQEYLQANGLPSKDTAASISVDFLETLAPELRQAQTMVLRLGSSSRKNTTRFALIGTPGRLDDFFLHDAAIFGADPPEPYDLDLHHEAILPYTVFKKPTETSKVNLAFASGLIGYALGLDRPYPTAAPATGSSTYEFAFHAHSAYPEPLHHRKGQVEIDAVFIGRRAGRPHLFILEAKNDPKAHTLAKHKLVYPILALAGNIPPDMSIVPVYLRVDSRQNTHRFHIVECSYPDPRAGITALDQLQPVRHRHLALTIPRS